MRKKIAVGLVVIAVAAILITVAYLGPILYPLAFGRPPRSVVIIVVSGLQVKAFREYSFPIMDELKSVGVYVKGSSGQFGGDTSSAYVTAELITATSYSTLHSLGYNVTPEEEKYKDVISSDVEEIFDVYHRHNYRVGVFIDSWRATILNAGNHSIDVCRVELLPLWSPYKTIENMKNMDKTLVDATCTFIKENRDQNFVAFVYLSQINEVGQVSKKRAQGALSADYRDAIKNVFENLIPQIVQTLKDNGLWNNVLLGIVGDFGFRNNPERDRWTGKYNYHREGQEDPQCNTIIWVLACPGGKFKQLLSGTPANFDLTATMVQISCGELPKQSDARVFYSLST